MRTHSKTPKIATKPRNIYNESVVKLQDAYKQSDGRILRLYRRNDKYAIYCLMRDKTINGYEVFKIRIRKSETIFGKQYPASESYPANSDFGCTAKSCSTLDAAEEYWDNLNKTGHFACQY